LVSSQQVVWNQLAVTGKLPTSRSEHTAVFRHSTREMIIFGGLHHFTSLQDTCAFNIDTKVWRELSTSGDVPPPVRKHIAILSEDERYASPWRSYRGWKNYW